MNTLNHIKFLPFLFALISLNVTTLASNIHSHETSTDSIPYDKVQQCYDLYVQGVTAESVGDTIVAQDSYNQYLSLNYRHPILNDIEIDLLARTIGLFMAKDDWNGILHSGNRLLSLDPNTQDKYHNTAWMYLMYVYALNMLNKVDEIDQFIQDALHYVDIKYKPTESEYYDLRFQYIIALSNRNDFSSANRLLKEVKEINDNIGMHVVDYEIEILSQKLLHLESIATAQNKSEFVEEFSKYVIDVIMATALAGYNNETESIWRILTDMGHNFLNNTYFDVYNIRDEDVWTKFMYWYYVFINGFAKGLNIPDRPQLAYNYVLTCKNFLDWHSRKSNKKEIEWQQIKECLNHDEIAIEFIPNNNEIILLSPHHDIPEIVEIDSLTMNRLSEYDSSNPLIINSFYTSDSPLTDIIRIIDPYLNGCHRIYISGSNRLAQFNWNVVPYKGATLDKFFDIRPLITTADIPSLKSRKVRNPKIDMVAMYGGIDYDNSPEQENTIKPETLWDYLSEVPSELRKGYGFLPYTKSEIDSIASLCDRHNIKYHKFSNVAANESTIKNVTYTSHSVLHIATHSFLLPDYSSTNLTQQSKETNFSRLGTVLSNTGLLFSGCNKSLQTGVINGEDGILTAKEIRQLDLSNVDLVVLSACSSGLGDLDNINGIIYGLTNAFNSAGAKQIMISLWDIPDYTTFLFMSSFYDYLLEGFSPRESLKSAQSHLISLGYTDPYYWGAFVILG